MVVIQLISNICLGRFYDLDVVLKRVTCAASTAQNAQRQLDMTAICLGYKST